MTHPLIQRKLEAVAARLPRPPVWGLISLAVLGLASALLLYTGYTRWFIRVGVLGLALVAVGFRPSRLVRGLMGASVLGLALVLVFYQLGGGSLRDWDEAIHAQIAKEMLLSHVWGTLSWNGSPFFNKPPLYFWLTALTYRLIGISELAARLWSAIFGFGVLVLTFVLGVRWHSWAVGAGAVLLLLGVNHEADGHLFNFLSQVRVGMLDAPLTFWIVMAVVLVREAEQRPWLITLIGLPTSLAVMTKAWPGFFVLVLPLGYWLLTRPRQARQPAYWVMAGGCAGIIILPWYLWQSWMHGSLFVQEYVGFNLIDRMSHVIEGHGGPPWFYLNILRRGFSIWGYLWPLAYLWAVKRAWQQGDRRLWLLLGWITVPLLAFSIAQTKLGWYIGIVYPAVALLLALALTDLLTERLAFGVVAAVMAVCCIRLPMAVEGAPGVRPFAASVAQHVAPGETIYAFERICKPRGRSLPDTVPLQAGQNVQPSLRYVEPSLRFYLSHTLRLRCLEARDLDDGFFQPDAYIIVHQKLRPHVQPPGQVVLEGDRYVLLRWRQ